MKLQEIFDLLSSSEFSQLSIGGANAGVINNSNYLKVMGHINLGLVSLYRRFNLKESQVVVRLMEDKFEYELKSANAVSKAQIGDVPYIIDSIDRPFMDDIIKVERVVGVIDELVCDLPLNDDNNEYSVHTPSNLVLVVSDKLIQQDLGVIYRAYHPKLVDIAGDFEDTGEQALELPYTHLDPLLYYVASRVHNPVGMSNEFHAGNSYAAKYEKACQELEMRGLQVDMGVSNTRLSRNGWV